MQYDNQHTADFHEFIQSILDELPGLLHQIRLVPLTYNKAKQQYEPINDPKQYEPYNKNQTDIKAGYALDVQSIPGLIVLDGDPSTPAEADHWRTINSMHKSVLSPSGGVHRYCVTSPENVQSFKNTTCIIEKTPCDIKAKGGKINLPGALKYPDKPRYTYLHKQPLRDLPREWAGVMLLAGKDKIFTANNPNKPRPNTIVIPPKDDGDNTLTKDDSRNGPLLQYGQQLIRKGLTPQSVYYLMLQLNEQDASTMTSESEVAKTYYKAEQIIKSQGLDIPRDRIYLEKDEHESQQDLVEKALDRLGIKMWQELRGGSLILKKPDPTNPGEYHQQPVENDTIFSYLQGLINKQTRINCRMAEPKKTRRRKKEQEQDNPNTPSEVDEPRQHYIEVDEYMPAMACIKATIGRISVEEEKDLFVDYLNDVAKQYAEQHISEGDELLIDCLHYKFIQFEQTEMGKNLEFTFSTPTDIRPYYLRMPMMTAIARAYTPGIKGYAFAFAGQQGCFKSQLFRQILPPEFTSGDKEGTKYQVADMGQDELELNRAGRQAIFREFEEAQNFKQDPSKVRKMLDAERDGARMSYARSYTQPLKRSVDLITSNRQDVLPPMADGERRILAYIIYQNEDLSKHFDNSGPDIDKWFDGLLNSPSGTEGYTVRDRLWGEAYYRYKILKDPIRFSGKLEKIRELSVYTLSGVLQIRVDMAETLMEMVEEITDNPKPYETRFTAAEIFENLGIRESKEKKLILSGVMEQMGIDPKPASRRTEHGQKRCYDLEPITAAGIARRKTEGTWFKPALDTITDKASEKQQELDRIKYLSMADRILGKILPATMLVPSSGLEPHNIAEAEQPITKPGPRPAPKTASNTKTSVTRPEPTRDNPGTAKDLIQDLERKAGTNQGLAQTLQKTNDDLFSNKLMN